MADSAAASATDQKEEQAQQPAAANGAVTHEEQATVFDAEAARIAAAIKRGDDSAMDVCEEERDRSASAQIALKESKLGICKVCNILPAKYKCAKCNGDFK